MSASSSAEALHNFGSDSGVRVCGGTQSTKIPPSIVVRVARSDDIIRFFGEPKRCTIQAIVAEMNDEIVGIIGIARDKDCGRYFCDFKPELQPHLRSITIMRAVKASMDLVTLYKGPLISIAEHAEGCRLLNRLGFKHLDGAVYEWVN